MNPHKKFKFLMRNYTLANKKEFLSLTKKRYRIRALIIPIRGSSTLSEYIVNGILKVQKPSSFSFKTLTKVKVQYISKEFLKFFGRNKQILKNVKHFTGNFSNLSDKRITDFACLANVMKSLVSIDDVARFTPKQGLKQKSYNFTFPSKSVLHQKKIQQINSQLDSRKRLSDKIYPLQKVSSVKFSPYLYSKHLFPKLTHLEIEASFLNQLGEMNSLNITSLIINDENTKAINPIIFDDSWKAIKKFESLSTVELHITDEENKEIVQIIKCLPKRPLNIHLRFDSKIIMSDEDLLNQLKTFSIANRSNVLIPKDWSNENEYVSILSHLA